MNDQFQIQYVIRAVDNATATLGRVEKAFDRINKAKLKMNSEDVKAARLKNLHFKAKSDEEIANIKATHSFNRKTEAIKRNSLIERSNHGAVSRSLDLKKKRLIVGQEEIRQLNRTNTILKKDSLELEKKTLANKREEIKNTQLLAKSRDDAALRTTRLSKSQTDLARSELSLANARIKSERNKSMSERLRLNDQMSIARTAMFTVAAPTAIQSALSLRNAMTMEQLSMRMGLQFGPDASMMMSEAKKYAQQTAFDVPGVMQLLTGMKVGAENLGLTSSGDIMELSKRIGNVALAYSTSKEDRDEMITQISQVAMRGKASTRQDLNVMQARGLPIYQALQSLTGLKLNQIYERYGAEIPAHLVIRALEMMSQSPQLMAMLDERSKSLTQSWDYIKESTFLTTSELGKLLDSAYGLRSAFKSLGDMGIKFSETLSDSQDSNSKILKSSIAYGVGLAIALPTALLIEASTKRLFFYYQNINKEAGRGHKVFAMTSAALLAASLYTKDWKEIATQFREEGILQTMAKNMDSVVLSIVAGYQAFKALYAITMSWNAVFAKTPLGLALAGVVASGYLAANASDIASSDKVQEMFLDARIAKAQMSVDGSIGQAKERAMKELKRLQDEKRNLQELKAEKDKLEQEKANQVNNKVEVSVQPKLYVNTTVDKSGNSKTSITSNMINATLMD